MRELVVVANWKMNFGNQDSEKFLEAFLESNFEFDGGKIVIVPSFPSLSLVVEKIKDKKTLFCGSQNISPYKKGAYTGEVSGLMLQEIGVSYVLIGHSERRTLFSEDNEMLQKKIARSLDSQLIPILCIGENLKEREENRIISVLENQLSILKNFSSKDLNNLIVAYEPVWAIGTNKRAEAVEIQDAHSQIRSLLSSLQNKIWANNVSILYGGSVNSKNAGNLLSLSEVDGALVGGASLNLEDFSSIVAQMY